MNNHDLTPQDIYNATRGGLDVILRYYPQAEDSVEKKNRKFSIRDEKTPSCILREHNGLYWVKDFGGGDRAMNAIDVAMLEERQGFREVLLKLAEDFEVEVGEKKFKAAKAAYERREPVENEPAVSWATKDWTVTELKSIFAANVWHYLSNKNKKDGERAGDEIAYREAVKICKQYNLYSLSSYSLLGNDKNDPTRKVVHVFRSTDDYPILMFNEGNWQKFYKPKEREAQYRFFAAGNKPDTYMFGYQQAIEKKLELNKGVEIDDESEEGASVKRERKLPELIISTGGSDALNLIAMGYPAVWFNSETVNINGADIAKLRGLTDQIYNMPDIDETGKREALKLALEYLEIHTIYLPEYLRKRYDMRGKACKDIRDYLNYYTPYDFSNLIKHAYPLRFWDEEVKRNKEGEIVKKFGRVQIEYKPNNELIYNFLYRMGFGKLEMASEKKGESLIQIVGNIVRKVEYRHVNAFVKSFLKERYSPVDLMNAFHRSPQFSENSLMNLDGRTVDFTSYGRDYQYMFFQNAAWRISAREIVEEPIEKCNVYSWDWKVVKHEVKKKEPMFRIYKDEKENWRIDISDNSSNYLKFLTHASRVYWRKELEDRLDELPAAERAEYRKKYHFSLNGHLMSYEEQQEQEQHLINKIITIGYLMHRYKDPANAYCVWAVDYNITNSEESHGGTGKSMAYSVLNHIKKLEQFEGRNSKLTQNPHIFESVTEHTDMLFIDDAHKYFDFDFFYSIITSFMRINPKGVQGYTLDFDDSPKMAVTSNFPPSRNDKATRRRLLFSAFSDYYHKNPNGEYREERLPVDEFGKSLFKDYDETEWNDDLNFMAQCCQAWMAWGKVEPPMDTLMQNQYRNSMGSTFLSWAESYFSTENGTLDNYVRKIQAHETYVKDTQQKLSAQGFKEKLKTFCLYNGYIFNPKELCNSKDGSDNIKVYWPEMIWDRNQWIEVPERKKTQDVIYIQTDPDSPIVIVEPDKKDDMPF